MRLATGAFLAALLAGSGFAAAQTTTPAPSTPATTAPATATPAPAPTTGRHKPATPAAATGTSTTAVSAGADEAAAKAKCGADTVVWGNPNSKVYHTSDSRYYGKTKKGTYMCMKDATAAGFHAAGKGSAHAKKPAGSTS